MSGATKAARRKTPSDDPEWRKANRRTRTLYDADVLGDRVLLDRSPLVPMAREAFTPEELEERLFLHRLRIMLAWPESQLHEAGRLFD